MAFSNGLIFKQFYRKKTVDIGSIQTQIVWIEGKHANH